MIQNYRSHKYNVRKFGFIINIFLNNLILDIKFKISDIKKFLNNKNQVIKFIKNKIVKFIYLKSNI